MRRTLAIILALSIFPFARTGAAGAFDYSVRQDSAMAEEEYCPPGALFCPAPGTSNAVFLDTNFGMTARPGAAAAYSGTSYPSDDATGELILYTSPPISVENRYVPYPGGPPAMPPDFGPPRRQPIPAPPQSYQARPGSVSHAVPPHRSDAESEVAYKLASRSDQSRDITRGDRVPWWKGGMWRNRRSSGSSNPPQASSPPSPQSSGGRQASAADDIWGGVDDEYSGYNPDGTFGRQGGNGNFYTATANPPPYSDPYAQPQYFPPQYPGQSHSQLQDAGGFVGESYSLPESSYPNSAYSGGSVYPGGGIPFDPAYNPGAYNSEIHGGGYSQPQAFPPAPMPIASAPQPGSGFIPPPPGGGTAYQVAVPAATPVSTEAGTGSVQFQNAVQLVKENRFREAKAILTDETSRDPLNASAWRWLGDCHYNLLELDAAIEAYRRALARDPNDYYALRGSGFANLHRGHEHWRRMQDEVARGQREQGAATFSQAHENYKTSLELLGLCLRRAPNDGEAIYGEAMAAEGASRKLYSNAVSFLRLGPENRERAEIFAENCLTVINKGIERATMRSQQNPGDSGPRALLGGLYLRKAILFNHLGKNELALIELKRARDVQQSILDEIDKNNATAQRSIQECDAYWEAWGGGGRSS